MKKFLLVFALCLFPAVASAQCSGVFTNGTVCGNATGSSNTPRMTPFTSFYTLPWTVPQGGTGDTSFTANLPLIGNGIGPIAQGTRSGNTTSFATTSGALTPGHCAQFDASGNLIDSAAACSSPGGSNTQIQYNNSGVFGGAANFTYVAGVPTVTNNALGSFVVQDASTSGDALRFGVTTTGGWLGAAPGTLLQFAPNTPAAQNMLTVNSERILQLSATSSVTNTSANPTMYLGDATSSCCLLPGNGGLVRTIPGVLFEYGNQQTAAAGPGPFTYNILSKSKNTVATTGANARDVHIYVWSFEDPASPRSAQPNFAFWSASGDYSNPSASVQGANIWEISGFAYCGTYDYCPNETSEIRGVLDAAATGTTAGTASSPGNIVFFNTHTGATDRTLTGGFFASGTFAIGNWAAYGNAFNTGDATLTVKEGGSVSTFTAGAGVFYVDANGEPRYLNNNASGAVAGNYYIPVLNADNGTSGHPVCYTRSGTTSVVLYVAAGTTCP